MKIGQLVQKPAINKLHKESDKLVDSKTLLGIEIEVENYKKPYDITAKESGYWISKEDHSLRNNGMEHIFAEPLYGADSVAAITWLFGQAVKQGWKISRLTGAHVHMDIRGLEMTEFKNLCTVYSIVEPLIYNWVGKDRHENMFCLPWYMADSEIKNISEAIRISDKDPKQALYFIKTLSKYSGLNINAAAKFGTVEFRMLETTFDIERFTKWLNIILSLKRYAITPALTPEIICKEASDLGAYFFASKVFGAKLTNDMWYPKFVKDIIGLGLVTADWFLDNVHDLEWSNKSVSERFTYARSKLLQKESPAIEEHDGLNKWKANNPPAIKPPIKNKGKKQAIEADFIKMAAVGQWAVADYAAHLVPPAPAPDWLDDPDNPDNN